MLCPISPPRLKALIACICLLVCGLWCSPPSHAQTDDIAESFTKISAEEAQQLRAILAKPVPFIGKQRDNTALNNHFNEKQAAARRLSDLDAEIAVLREAVSTLPNSLRFKHNLAMRLYERGGADQEANALMRQAIAGSDEIGAIFRSSLFACKLLDQGKPQEATRMTEEVRSKIQVAKSTPRDMQGQLDLIRASRHTHACMYRLELRLGHRDLAIEAATQAVAAAREAEVLMLKMPAPSPSMPIYVRQELAASLSMLLQAYRYAGRLNDAEQALKEYIAYSKAQRLPPRMLSFIYSSAASLRFSQREFAQSEVLNRKADEMLARVGDPETSLDRAHASRDLIGSLLAQAKWDAALAERQRLDKLADSEPKLKGHIGNNFDSGVLYFGNRQYTKAADYFAKAANFDTAILGENHFNVAVSQGMQGAALWRAGDTASRAASLPLLKAAVRAYMLPANADYLENIGTRKERREDVFAAYLEALALTPGEDPTQAMGAADWVRSGTVQEALNDAAVRAAARTPALAQLVRQEQDLKLQILGLRNALGEEAAQTLSKSRETIAGLERERIKLQADIKSAMPDYDQLVRPTAPSVKQIAQRLDSDQAMLLLLPTADAVYVWAVSADRPAAFVRAEMSAQTLKTLVEKLRRQLDFGNPDGGGTRFDSANAFQLYNTLLAPVASAWRGKPQLIVAAGGVLGQIPFGLLQTRAGAGFDSKAPWLIKDAAITQVPSLSAWLAIQAMAPSVSANQSFAAWGDPVFRSQSGKTSSRSGTRSQAKGSGDLPLDLDALSLPAASGLRYADIPPLPETRDELLAIAKILKSDPARDLYLGGRATRDSVLAASSDGSLQNKRVIAFATHGLVAGELPRLTQPALALAATDDAEQNPLAPLLTLEDVLTLKLNADWVVLSACNTASGDGKGEEALSGLARGFFYAGSRSVLVTHWAVESDSAKLLTTNTFAHYAANPKAPKAESLRQAMLKVMANPKYAHPAFWAPYALVGDGGR
jgi:CHAT domain-containing protein